ncbi:MAG: hypothetical protein ACKOU7_14665 [Ferruginibacter sp.]
MKSFLLSFLISVTAIQAFAQNADETAIKQLLEKESATWRLGDVKAHAACWAIKPYSKIVVSTVDGNMIDIDPGMMINPPASMVGKGGSAINTNYKMNISGNNAWVSHNEESTDTEGAKSYSIEFRMLEKINGQWKLVGQSIHIYKPK